MIKKVYQQSLKDCGVACLISVIRYYKGDNTFHNVRYLTHCSNNGVTALNLIEASKKLGFDAEGLKCEYNNLKDITMPCICHITLNNFYNHYVVIYKVTDKDVLLFDPYLGIKKYDKNYFMNIWKSRVIISLVPNRKLDVIRDSNFNVFKDIMLKNSVLYFLIVIVSFLAILLTLLTNTYFKTLIDGNTKIYILYLFALIIIIKELFSYIRNGLLIKLEYKIDKDLQFNTHYKLLSLPNYYFNSRNVGDIITKFNDLNYVKELLIQPIIIFIDVLLMVVSFIILINIDLNLSIIFFIIGIIYLLVLILFNKKITNLVSTYQESNSYKNSILEENISCIDTIKNMNLIKYRDNIFKEITLNNIECNKNYEKEFVLLNLIKNSILFIGINIILYIGINSDLSLSKLVLFNSIMLYFVEPLNDLSNIFSIIKNGMNAIKRLCDVFSFNNKEELLDINNYDLTINNLNFSYNNYDYVLSNINYNIKYKDKIMVIGKSGCGKSTLFKLINKSYEISNNVIKIGSVDLNNVNINKYITYVSQNEKLFNDTVFNNIVLDNKESNLEKVISVTKLDEVLKRRGMSLNSIIEENGLNLSLGERQKIIISRVLLKDSPILILDESLSGIDNNDEYEIISNILCEFSNKTIVYISHSKVCLNLFNKILDFDKIGGKYEIIKS